MPFKTLTKKNNDGSVAKLTHQSLNLHQQADYKLIIKQNKN